MRFHKQKQSAVMRLYKIGRKFYTKRVYVMSGFISRLIRVIYACELPMSCEIDPSCDFVHNGLGVVVHQKATIGRGTKIYQNVTIGGRNDRGYPTIGEFVFIGCGACILGGVKVGDGARIGANSVVLTDIPPFSTAVGVPAKVVKINSDLCMDVIETKD